MTEQNDTLNPGAQHAPPPSNATPAPPGTPPGQQQGEPGQPPQSTPPSPPATAPGQQSGSSEGDDTVALPKSKADFDARIEQAKRSSARELLEMLDFKDVAHPDQVAQAVSDLKELVQFAREQRREQMTAAERVEADLTTARQNEATARQQRDQAEQERDTARQQLREFVMRSAITAAAAGAAHPADVYDLYARVYAQDQLTQVIKPDAELVSADGAFNPDAIDADAVQSIIDQCKQDRKEWWAGAGARSLGTPSNAGGQPPPGDVSKLEQGRELARANLRSM